MEENNFNQNMNNINPEISENQYSENAPQTNEERSKSIGSIIGLAIIIVILIFGGLYYWGAQINKQQTQEQLDNTTAEMIENQPDAALEQLQAQNESDEISDIEIDLNDTVLEGLDQELENIDVEFSF
ncbi:hypothetical protein A2Z61_00870 [Candidatus Campbellbacteria bacterium RIFCSPLOWO2_02_35_12]|uniref:Uncharacterized protein n=1 Tax=Candidatus Campbellbacteria bacterium RIFCSPLOWO2_02_35_12 TaxID=1797580 RepID=A0A1F5EJF8_9BACT|nr:MAG: hypothetical protein A2Z61_00870 [Candidatus Campbellbacteria bacterium RIFCSPLOWO2_02_35_12]